MYDYITKFLLMEKSERLHKWYFHTQISEFSLVDHQVTDLLALNDYSVKMKGVP